MTETVPPWVLEIGSSRKAAPFPLFAPTLRQYLPKRLRESAIECQPPFLLIDGSSQEMSRVEPPPPGLTTTNAEGSRQNEPEGESTATSCGPSGAPESMAIWSVALVPPALMDAGPSWMPSPASPSLLKT